MRRLWARVVVKLEDTHRRRTVMANAKANATSLDEIDMPPYRPLELDTPEVDWFGRKPKDFDG